MKNIEISSVICRGCRLVMMVDGNGLCEFCRRAAEDSGPREITAYQALCAVAVMAVVVGLFAAGLWVLGVGPR